MPACLDDETVLGLVEGRLPPPALAAVDDHLDACATCRDVIAQLSRAQAPSILARGATLGRYVIGDLLGSGAMGRVYSAWQPELDRSVAIKVLREDVAAGRDRLLREAQAMARLDHPNVVGVHEVGTSDAGVHVVMDLVEGATLRAWADTARPWRDVVRVLADIARGLAAVHAAGVLHRDVKPDNIIVGRDGRARLGDFGLARAHGAPADPPREVAAIGTPATAIAGTPAYMAPELLRGGPATMASDQFAFGITAYEVLCGKRPVSGQTWSDLLAAYERGAIAGVRGVPRAVDAAIRRCLAVAPGRRHASMTDVADELTRAVDRRRPLGWVAAAVVVASGTTWFVASRGGSTAPACELGAAQVERVWSPPVRDRIAALDRRTERPLAPAFERWAHAWAAEQDALCTAATREPPATIAARASCLDHQRAEIAALLDRMTKLDAVAADARVLDAVAGLVPGECRQAVPNTADPRPADPDLAAAAGDVERRLPEIRAVLALGDPRPARDQLAPIVERARASGHAPTLAEALLVDAEAARAAGDLDAATIAARAALAAAERGHDDLAAARAWIVRLQIAGDRRTLVGDPRELTGIDDLVELATAAIDRAGTPPRLAAELLRSRALIAYNRGHYEEAKTLLHDAASRFSKLAGEGSLEIASIESALGSTARAAGDLELAETHHERALAIDRELRGPAHPDVARDLHNLAGVHRLRGSLDTAERLYREALAIEVAMRGAASVEAALTHNSLGLVAMARADWPTAQRELETALAALTAAGHGDRAFAEHNLGIVAAARGDTAAALAHYDRAAQLYARTIGPDAPSAIRLDLDRAHAQLATSPAAARASAQRALDAATRADIQWIADDARALLARPARPAATLVRTVEPPPQLDRAADPPQRADEPAIPAIPPAKPQPKRDVGTYGASQGW
ncbi:MAG TPA: serine/threonine-protein kinase [Kofleriaceae bacterium]|nr:serine/threonine-protein kinase [Kofleriaceae bacterium]